MGQSASKVAKSVVSSTSRTVVGKDPTVVSSSVVGAATKVSNDITTMARPSSPQPVLQHPQHQAPPQHQSSFPSPPTRSTPGTSIHDHHDAVQRRILEEKAGSLEYKEMPQDLVNFLKDAGPLQQRTTTISTSSASSDTAAQQERKLRLPRHLRHLESSSSNNDKKDGNDDEDEQQAAVVPSSSSPEQRHVESMRLVENIPGFETSRSTNFSTKPAPNDNDDPTIFQAGQVLDIYDMIMLLRQRKDESSTINTTSSSNVEAQQQQQEEVVQEIYEQYANKITIPDEDTEQERHRELLRKTLTYLDVPVIMKDMADGSYDGVCPEHVADFEFLGGLVMPTTSVMNVLQDFSDIRKKEAKESST